MVMLCVPMLAVVGEWRNAFRIFLCAGCEAHTRKREMRFGIPQTIRRSPIADVQMDGEGALIRLSSRHGECLRINVPINSQLSAE